MAHFRYALYLNVYIPLAAPAVSPIDYFYRKKKHVYLAKIRPIASTKSYQ